MDGSGNFDPCECINMIQMNHQSAMAHLTNLLRNAQTTCTDTECFTGPLPGIQNTGGNTGMTNMYLILAIWIGLALLLFLFRPRSLRSNSDPLLKPMRQNTPNTGDRDPPAPSIQ